MLCAKKEKILLPIVLCSTQIGLLDVSQLIKAQLIFMEHFSVQYPGLALSTHGLILPSRHWAVPSYGNSSLFLSAVGESAGSLKLDRSRLTLQGRKWRGGGLVNSLAGKVALLTKWRAWNLDPGEAGLEGHSRHSRPHPGC